MPPPMIATRVMSVSGQRAPSPVHDGNRASALRMVAARSVIENGVAREIHDEHVHQREARRIEPRHVKLVMANWNGDIILRREFRSDKRAFYRNALDHRMAVRLLERVAGVPAEGVGRVEDVPLEVESLELEV